MRRRITDIPSMASSVIPLPSWIIHMGLWHAYFKAVWFPVVNAVACVVLISLLVFEVDILGSQHIRTVNHLLFRNTTLC